MRLGVEGKGDPEADTGEWRRQDRNPGRGQGFQRRRMGACAAGRGKARVQRDQRKHERGIRGGADQHLCAQNKGDKPRLKFDVLQNDPLNLKKW